MKLSSVQNAGGLLVALVTSRWMSTLDYRGALYDERADPVHPEFRGPAIFLFWHEYIPFLFYLRGHCGIAMLLSRHQDAEWLAKAARHMGFETVRGSTNRGGVSALRELFQRGRAMNLAITPDGPRGPRRTLAPGAVFVASRLGIPLIPIGLGYECPWRLSTWDKFAVPRPFSRARAIAGPPVFLARDLDREGLELARQQVESDLNQLTEAAEHWAETGKRMQNERPLRREPAADLRQKMAPLPLRAAELDADDVHPGRGGVRSVA
jgi:lysophospholipid acyltransferase (LPLAT)-like uncharacterized protein